MKRFKVYGFFIILLGTILSIIVTGCRSTENGITVIVVRNNYHGYYSEHKVDLVAKEYLRAVSIRAEDDVEEYTYKSELTDKKIAAFHRAVKKYGMLSWDEEYVSPTGSFHSYSWTIIIHYSDSTEKRSFGAYDNYPDSWDDMYEAFFELTGDFVLTEKRPKS